MGLFITPRKRCRDVHVKLRAPQGSIQGVGPGRMLDRIICKIFEWRC